MSENSSEYEKEVIIEKEVTREVDVEVERTEPVQEVTTTVEVVTEPVTTEVQVTRETTTNPVPPDVAEHVDSDASYEVSVEQVVEVERVVQTEVVRNGEVIERIEPDTKLHLNYRKNRLTTFVKTMEFLKTTESSRFSHQAEMMKRNVRFRNFKDFIRLYLSDENRLKEYVEGKLKKEDVSMASRIIVDEDILEKMRQFYLINSKSDKRVTKYSNLIDYARKNNDKDFDEEARLVEKMEGGLEEPNSVQFGMYGLRSTDETEGLWGLGYVPYDSAARDALDEDTEDVPLVELPPLPEEGETQGEETWRKNGFFVRNRSRRLAFNDALVFSRDTCSILGADGKEEDFESGKKVDFEYEIFGHLVVDMNHAMLWKKTKLNSERAVNERKIAVRKYIGKKKVSKINDESINSEVQDFLQEETELEQEATKIRTEYSAEDTDLSTKEEKISEFFKIVKKSNMEDLASNVRLSSVNVDEYIQNERSFERSYNTRTTKETRVMSIIEGVAVDTIEVKREEIESENAGYDNTVNPFVQEVFQVGDTYVSLYLMEVLEDDVEKRAQALREIISRGDFIFLKEEYRNLGMSVESDILDDRMFENENWLYMVYFKGGYRRLFGLMDSRFTHYRTDLVKIYEPGHTGQRYKSNFFNHTSKITERTNESISSEGSAYRNQLVRWNFADLETQNSEYIEWTRKTRLVYDVRQLSIREVMWSMGYLRNDQSIDGRIMPFWPFSPVRKDELNIYLERRPQLKSIMATQGKEVVLRERELSISSTSSHEYERVYQKDVEKEVNIEIIEKNKPKKKLRKSSTSESGEEMIVKDQEEFSNSDSNPSSNSTSTTKSRSSAGKGVILAMIVWGSIVVGSMLGSKIAVMNLLPPPVINTPSSNPTPATRIDPKTRVQPVKNSPPKKVDTPVQKDPPQIVLKKESKPQQSSTQTPVHPTRHKTSSPHDKMKLSKTHIKPTPSKGVPPKIIKTTEVKAPQPKTPNPPQKIMVDSSHQTHTFIVEHHYIQPQYIIPPNQGNPHPPIININNETASESQAAPVPTPAPVTSSAQTQVIHQPVQTQAPVVVTPQPSGPIHVQPKIEFNPIIQPTINVPVDIKSTTTQAKAPPSKTVNKTYNNHHIVNSLPGNHVEKIVESTNQVDEVKQAHKNQNNMIVSDENELPDINALVNDIKFNMSPDQEMHDLQNLIIHRDMTKARKAADNHPMKIIIENKSSSHHHHRHHHHSGGGFLGILTTTIKRHPKRSHHRGSSFGMTSSHHHHSKHNNGFISQIRVKSATPEAPPVKIRKSVSGKIKASDEMLKADTLNAKDHSASVKAPVMTRMQPVAVHPMPFVNCSKNAVIPVAMRPSCNKHKKKRRRKRKRKLRVSKKKKHRKKTRKNSLMNEYYDPLFDNNDAVMDNSYSLNNMGNQDKDWDKRFNMFQYFDQSKGRQSPDPENLEEDPANFLAFDYPNMMQMGLDNGLNEKKKTTKRKSKKSKNLSI